MSDERTRDENEGLISIGQLAEETGLAPDTIRVWERRYGKPVPVRLPSGHRRYRRPTVTWLRRVAEALSRGHRPHKVVRLGDAELNALLEDAEATDTRMADEALRLIRAGDRAALDRQLASERARRSPLAFVLEVATPLAHAVGRAWADGELNVRHEHFFAEVLEHELRGLRRALPEGNGRVVLFTTLSGERHGLGIQMAAVAAQIAGARPLVLGIDTPDEEIPLAAADHGASFVALSVSLATGGVEIDRRLARLREALPSDVALVVGGAGARGVRRGPRGVTFISDLREFTALVADA